MITKRDRYLFRKERVRRNLFRSVAAPRKPRLAVYCSLKYIYAQVVDDSGGKTLAFVSTLGKEFNGPKAAKSAKSVESAKVLGDLMAKKALAAGINQVCFDRAGRIYHGRIKAFADSARQAGLKF